MTTEVLTRPATGADSAIQTVRVGELVSFEPVSEPGWIIAELAVESEPGRSVYNIYPMIGYATFTVSDGVATWRDIVPVTNYLELEWIDNPAMHIYYSRALFREAQGGSIALSRPQLLKAVSE